MEQNINIEFIVTTLKLVSRKHSTNTIQIAKGRWELPTKLKHLFKKLRNG